jgi:murein DD-endopeptidase
MRIRVLAVLLCLIATLAEGRQPVVQSLDVSIPQQPAVVTVDGVRHLVYEVHITNLRPVDVALTRVEVVDADNASRSIGDFRDVALQQALGRPGVAGKLTDTKVIAGGLRAVLYLWLPVTNGSVPDELVHRIAFDVIRPEGRTSAVIQSGRVNVQRDPPVVLSPPVQEGRWIAVYGPSVEFGHRRFIYTIDGRARIPARFAIDWMKLGDDNKLSRGDGVKLTDWYGYGSNVLAVADAVVVEANDDIPEEATISASHGPMPLENASGNYVVLDLGRGRYAFYEHLKQGSIRVKPGNRVRRGDVIALLGNTGSSSSGPHLHFHVSDGTTPLGAEGLPFVIDQFEVEGGYSKMEDVATGNAPAALPPGMQSQRRNEMPAPNAVLKIRANRGA